MRAAPSEIMVKKNSSVKVPGRTAFCTNGYSSVANLHIQPIHTTVAYDCRRSYRKTVRFKLGLMHKLDGVQLGLHHLLCSELDYMRQNVCSGACKHSKASKILSLTIWVDYCTGIRTADCTTTNHMKSLKNLRPPGCTFAELLSIQNITI
jgi:hypothetical protein